MDNRLVDEVKAEAMALMASKGVTGDIARYILMVEERRIIAEAKRRASL